MICNQQVNFSVCKNFTIDSGYDVCANTGAKTVNIKNYVIELILATIFHGSMFFTVFMTTGRVVKPKIEMLINHPIIV